MQQYSEAQKMLNFQWWRAEENSDEVHKRLMNYVRDWDSRNTSISLQHVRHLRLYSNREVQKLTMAQHTIAMISDKTSAFSTAAANRGRLTLNVCKSCVDTLVNKIGKNKTRPLFLTTGGIVEQQTRAKRMNQFLFGALNEGKAYRVGPLALRDAFIFGDGYAKIVRDKNNRRNVERVVPDEIIVDPIDGYYGAPRVFVQRRFCSRDAIAEAYPEHVAKIRAVPTAAYQQEVVGHTDAIIVAEAWHLGEPGRHVICCEGVCLLDEEFKAENFPVRRISYTPAVVGYFSQGVIEEITGIQIEINRLLLHVQESMRRLGNPRVYLEIGSKVMSSHITNSMADIIYYSGQKPLIEAAATVAPETFAQIDVLYNRGFEIIGISRLSAQAQKPPGLNSGVALDSYADIETERFARTSQAYDEFIMDLGEAIIDDMDHEVDVDGGNPIVSAASTDAGLTPMRWKEVRLPRDRFLLQCFPASAFPKTPAGKLNMVNYMIENGFVDKEEGRRLLDFPDLEHSNRDKMSPTLLAFTICERALFEGEVIVPDTYMHLPTLKAVSRGLYCWSLTVDVPEENRALLRKVIDTCTALEAQTAQKIQAQSTPPPEALQAMAAAQGLPPGNGMMQSMA